MSGIDVPAPSEREAFEKWADANQFCIHRDDSDKYRDYHRATTRFAWEAWQARAALSVPCRLDTDQSSCTSDHAAPAPSSSGGFEPLGMKRDAARWQWFSVWWFSEGGPPPDFMTVKTLGQLNAIVDAAIASSEGPA